MLRKTGLILVFVVALLFAVYRNYTFFRERRGGSRLLSSTLSAGVGGRQEPTGKGADVPVAIGISKVDRVRFERGEGRDPFRLSGKVPPAIRPGEPFPLPRLETILTSSRRRLAVLNGEICREGDTLFGRKVLRIEPESVILSGEGGGIRIEFSQDGDPRQEEVTP